MPGCPICQHSTFKGQLSLSLSKTALHVKCHSCHLLSLYQALSISHFHFLLHPTHSFPVYCFFPSSAYSPFSFPPPYSTVISLILISLTTHCYTLHYTHTLTHTRAHISEVLNVTAITSKQKIKMEAMV